MNKLLPELSKRYKAMALKLSNVDSRERIPRMLDILIKNSDSWNHYKIGVWIGCIQTLIITEGVTTFELERDFTRPLHHAFFKRNNYDIPDTTDVMK